MRWHSRLLAKAAMLAAVAAPALAAGPASIDTLGDYAELHQAIEIEQKRAELENARLQREQAARERRALKESDAAPAGVPGPAPGGMAAAAPMGAALPPPPPPGVEQGYTVESVLGYGERIRATLTGPSGRLVVVPGAVLPDGATVVAIDRSGVRIERPDGRRGRLPFADPAGRRPDWR